MRINWHRARFAATRSAGFSLVELMVVLAIIAIVTAVAVPSLTTAISNSKLRGAASSLAGLMQDTRMQAVRQNRTLTVRFMTRGGVPIAFAKRVDSPLADSANTGFEVALGPSTFQVAVPSGGTPALSDTVLSFTPLNLPDLASFNPRGMPCKYASGACTTSGFTFYVKDTTKTSAWAAVSVSPGGRVKQWFWNGQAWVD